MKKHKVIYKLREYASKSAGKITAKREISYEIRLASKLILDELCFNWNKAHLESKLNESIDMSDREAFMILSEEYQPYTWE